MSCGIQDWTSASLGDGATQLGLDGKEGKTYEACVQKKFRGKVLGMPVGASKGEPVAVKTFKPKKSSNRILKEAELQQICAAKMVSPPVLGVSMSQKYIVMPRLDSLPVETYRDSEMPSELQYAICGLMGLMDDANVLHCDMNARNVMLDSDGRPWMIDFGLAKKITKQVTKKHGAHPNIAVSLWGLVRGFKRYKVGCSIMQECQTSEDPEEYIQRGKYILSNMRRKIRKRKRK